jgi:uncharacterized protein (DUF1499 family)
MPQGIARAFLRAAAFAAALLLADPAMASPFGTLFSGSPPSTLGVRDGRLAPCPERPNCVSSQASDEAHLIAPLAFAGDAPAAMATLAAVIRAMPRATIVTARPDYLHVEFASATMGFVDDAEFVLDAGAKRINLRSAARLGYRDFGVNHERIEAIRTSFAILQP